MHFVQEILWIIWTDIMLHAEYADGAEIWFGRFDVVLTVLRPVIDAKSTGFYLWASSQIKSWTFTISAVSIT